MAHVRLTRRAFIGSAIGAVVASRTGRAQQPVATQTFDATDLTIGYQDSGNSRGFPVILIHGFPDDVHAYDEVVPLLVAGGCRAIVPYLRGFGPTRFRTSAMRSGEQAALAQDVADLADHLQLRQFSVGGYDWGNRTACITAALHPDRVRSAVLVGGYSIYDPFAPQQPGPPDRERAIWHFFYFNTERGRAALASNRRGLCRYFWQMWSPSWRFSDEVYERTAASFDNPDFVDVSCHFYRHRLGSVPGDPRFDALERQLARRPRVEVPTILLLGTEDGTAGPPSADATADRANFAKLVDRRIIEGAGHFLPRENPQAFAKAVLDTLRS
jgi:pimeloyl-ACP methyl ester carboxylesterase